MYWIRMIVRIPVYMSKSGSWKSNQSTNVASEQTYIKSEQTRILQWNTFKQTYLNNDKYNNPKSGTCMFKPLG